MANILVDISGRSNLQGQRCEGDRGQGALRAARPCLHQRKEGGGRTPDDTAVSGWQEALCHHLPLQCMGQPVLPQPCQVRGISCS